MPTLAEVTLNAQKKLYVIPCGDGYSCWGYDNAFRDTTSLAEQLKETPPSMALYGTLALYARYHEMIARVNREGILLGTWWDSRTPMAVRLALETARKNEDVVRIWLGDPDTGKAWLEEHDVIGHIGRSTGPIKVPLLVPKGEHGGGAILTANVLRIARRDGRDLYRHPKFSVPEMNIGSDDDKKYPAFVTVDGELHARFKDRGKAAHFIAFIHGESFDYPKET